MRVIEIQPTPNPNALKFVLDGAAFQRPFSASSVAQAAAHPLAAQLFGAAGVSNILMLGNFVTVNKQAAVKWHSLRAKITKILEGFDGEGR